MANRGWGLRRPMRVGLGIVVGALLVSAPAAAERIEVAAVPVPDDASEVDRNSDIEMITYRSDLDPAAVQDFYRKALSEQGWEMDDEDSFLVEGVGSLTFANGDDEFRIAIQDGRPDSRTRMIVMGEGVKWASSEWDDLEGGPDEAPAEAGELVANGQYDLPVPTDCESVTQTGTPFRSTVDAEIRRPLADVVAFYRRELPKGGWTDVVAEEETPGESLRLDLDGASGPLRVELRKKRKDTLIHMVTRDTDAARKAGVLPEPGQARLLLGNTHDVEATIVVDAEERRVAAGTGAADPSAALALTIPPGSHEVTIKLAGEADQTETLEIGADETWAVMVLPTGGDFADRVY